MMYSTAKIVPELRCQLLPSNSPSSRSSSPSTSAPPRTGPRWRRSTASRRSFLVLTSASFAPRLARSLPHLFLSLLLCRRRLPSLVSTYVCVAPQPPVVSTLVSRCRCASAGEGGGLARLSAAQPALASWARPWWSALGQPAYGHVGCICPSVHASLVCADVRFVTGVRWGSVIVFGAETEREGGREGGREGETAC